MVGLGTPSTAFSHPSGPTIICMNNMDPFTNIKGIAGGADPYLSPSLISLSLRRRNYKAVRTGTFFIQGLMTIPTCTTQYLGFSGVGEGGGGGYSHIIQLYVSDNSFDLLPSALLWPIWNQLLSPSFHNRKNDWMPSRFFKLILPYNQ